MLEEIARFLIGGGTLLIAAAATFLLSCLALTAACLMGAILYLRQPKLTSRPRSLNHAAQGIISALFVLPLLLSVIAALIGRGSVLEAVQTAPVDMKTYMLVASISAVLSSTAFFAMALVPLAMLAGPAMALWGPVRTRFVDRANGLRLQRDVEAAP